MAVSRKTQKDIGNYEPKFLGPFTKRMCIFVGLGVLIGGFVGFFLKAMGTDMTTMAMVVFVIAAGFAIFGKAEKYGLKMEDYLLQYYQYHYQSPAVRKYQTQTSIDRLTKEEIRKYNPSIEDDTDELPKKSGKKSKPAYKPDPEFPRMK